MSEPITDYTARLLHYMMGQYRRGPHMEGVVRASGIQADALEEALREVGQINLATAIGATLDMLGHIFLVDRPYGMADEDYRQLIRNSIGSQLSGTPEEVITAIISMYSQDPANPGSLHYWTDPAFPATVFLHSDDLVFTADQVESLLPVGVQVVESTLADDLLIYETADGDDPYTPILFQDGTGYVVLQSL